MGDEEFVEVDAVVRMPKDRNLADSKKTEGWSRGFTPKSSERGPEHVEIRLKGPSESQDAASPEPHADPQIFFVSAYAEQPYKTREQEEAEEAARLLLSLALLRAAEWAQPRLQRLWDDRIAPFFEAKREQRQQQKGPPRFVDRRARRAASDTGSDAIAPTPASARAGAGKQADEVGAALAAYSANMTSDEARAHLVELLIAQHLVNEKTRLLANARVDGEPVTPELANAVQALTAQQVQDALNSLLSARPSLLGDIGQLIAADRGSFARDLRDGVMRRALSPDRDGE